MHSKPEILAVKTVARSRLFRIEELKLRFANMLARDLYPKRLPADEPEDIDVVAWPLDRIPELVQRADFTEARAIAALFLAQQRLGGHAV